MFLSSASWSSASTTARSLTRHISSVLAQTAVGHCEILVVDGGSDDPATIAKMRELANDPPPRTRVLLREDGRHLIGDNRNFGIARARGRYVTCLDADDLLDPRYLEIALYLLERRGYDAVSTATLCFGSANGFFDLMESPDLSDMLRANHLTTVAVFRRELWERAGGYHDVGLGADYVYEDWKFWVRIAALGARMTNIRAPLFRYRAHSTESLSQQGGAVRDMAAHRAAVMEFNEDVVSPEALAESARRRGLEITVEGGIENLKIAEQANRPTILIALAVHCDRRCGTPTQRGGKAPCKCRIQNRDHHDGRRRPRVWGLIVVVRGSHRRDLPLATDAPSRLLGGFPRVRRRDQGRRCRTHRRQRVRVSPAPRATATAPRSARCGSALQHTGARSEQSAVHRTDRPSPVRKRGGQGLARGSRPGRSVGSGHRERGRHLAPPPGRAPGERCRYVSDSAVGSPRRKHPLPSSISRECFRTRGSTS